MTTDANTHAAEQAAAASPTATPPALVTFDPAGPASVISYQVPEPTSYLGKHVLTLNYGLADFAAVASPAVPSPQEAPHANLARSDEQPAGVAAAAATAPSLSDRLVLPNVVVASDSSDSASPVVAMAPFELSQRLSGLRWSDVALVAEAGKRIEVFRSISGQLDYRVRDAPGTSAGSAASGATATPATRTAQATASVRPLALPVGFVPPDPPDPPERPSLTVVITSPTASSGSLSGPWNGLALTVSCETIGNNASASGVKVDLLNSAGTVVTTSPATLTDGTWQASLSITASGQYTISAVAQASGDGVRVVNRSIAITVALAAPPVNAPAPPPPAVAPSVTVTSPTVNMVIPQPGGDAIVTISGNADTNGASAVTVSASIDSGPVSTVALPTPTSGTTTAFTTTATAVGYGPHTLLVSATNADGISAPPVTVPFSVLASQPIVPLNRQLFLMEKLAITSFLGDFGASRVVKTFSLLPGEQTTISVDSYTKDDSTASTTSSILDSSATEAAGDFEDTVNDENDSKAAIQNQTNLSVSGDVGANWGWGHADIKAGFSDQANASRENTVKTVQNAVQKHTSKASSNRSVSVNTDFSTTTSTGNTTDTIRTLSNINVSRVLNCVFRQLTQQHQVIISLVDATVGYYAQDELVDAAGNPLTGSDGGPLTQESFTEYTLPEMADFATTQMTGPAVDDLPKDLTALLGRIPDYQGTQQALIETVTPTGADGTPDPDAAYQRVKPDLTQTYTDVTGATFTVKGIILGQSTYVLRTDQLLCDALLGEGNALDDYSQELQNVAISERQAAVAATVAATAREQLAQQIITDKDADAAAVWQKIYPQPLSVPATVMVPTAAGSNGDGAATG